MNRERRGSAIRWARNLQDCHCGSSVYSLDSKLITLSQKLCSRTVKVEQRSSTAK